MNERDWKSQSPEKYRFSNFSVIPLEERVATRIDGKWNENKYSCRRCGEQKLIRNPKYHLCSPCTNKEQFIGETCECCQTVADGTFAMTRVHESESNSKRKTRLYCMNCRARMLRFGIGSSKLKALLSIKNCEICDRELRFGREGGNAFSIDHNHETGHIRGVLCANCNKAEGYISNISEDPIVWINKLSEYLQR